MPVECRFEADFKGSDSFSSQDAQQDADSLARKLSASGSSRLIHTKGGGFGFEAHFVCHRKCYVSDDHTKTVYSGSCLREEMSKEFLGDNFHDNRCIAEPEIKELQAIS